MSNSKTKSTHAALDQVLNFVDSSGGLQAKMFDGGKVEITQDLDRKVFTFNFHEIHEILHRSDADGKPFLQVNFKNNTKVLLTDSLIGFKPIETFGLDMNRIPKVVTTPDLTSVFDAIEESMGADGAQDNEVEVLKKVYNAIISGGEKVGFNLDAERVWLNRLLASKFRASA